MSDDAAADEFAALLRELKDRSGLSYGLLAKRLHMSTSTLHRYCNGDAVPTDYAPVERLARLCKAAPEELVELHRRWVRADALRGRKGGASGSSGFSGTSVVSGSSGVSGGEAPAEGGAEEGVAAAGEALEGLTVDEPSGGGRRRTRVAVVAGVSLAAVLGAVTLAMSLPFGGAGGDDGGRSAGAVSVDSGRTDSPRVSASPSHASPSSTTGKGKETGKGAGQGKGGGGQAEVSRSASAAPSRGGDAAAGLAAPLDVTVAPYTWESPCSQRYLIDREPGEVPPPPLEQDAAAWVASTGAVSSGEQYLTLTVQGTGAETVVVDSLTVRTVDRGVPLARNDYAMGYPGVGCGGNVPTRSFTVALDAQRPAVVPEAGSRDFPYKVSEADPEVYYIRADASAYDVSWVLEVSWSSGSRHGTLQIDDRGRPFRTSGNNGRPAYEFPLGGEAWVKAGTTEKSQGSQGS
ncbi:helix-turn-helix domain-containing protein [Streptomyces sp. NPDC050287]|uniref:helix-turn-helix domain-containing protein n=1 Tax=Streptomyces sp. NPDC050287 TaxID=3365608 RepID=UPI0037BD0A63